MSHNADVMLLEMLADQAKITSGFISGLQRSSGVPLLPEALCLLCEGSWVPSIGRLVQLGQQGLAGLLARVVGEFDCDGLGGTGWLLAVQTLDGLLGLHPPVEADEADPSGNTCGERLANPSVISSQAALTVEERVSRHTHLETI